MIQFPFLAGQLGFTVQQAGTSGPLKKLITITGATGAGTNYQVLFKVGESSGSASPNFYFDSLTTTFPSAKNAPGDVQFTDTGGTALPQWVEQVTGTTPNRVAWIWVKVSADLGTNQDIYCTYRNGGTKASDGTTVFSLFDDFDGGSLDTGKWTYGTGGPSGLSFGSSVMTLTGNATTRQLWSATTYADGMEVLGRINPPGTTASYVGFFGFNNSLQFDNDFNTTGTSEVLVNNTTRVQLASRFQTTYYRMRVRRAGGTAHLLIDDVLQTTQTGVNTSAQVAYLASAYDNTSVHLVDWMAIKKYQATEPVFGSAGSEIAA